MTQLYANDSFLKLKEKLTEEMLQNNENIVNLMKEQKSMISEADKQLEDLHKWRATREARQREEEERQRATELELEREYQKKRLILDNEFELEQ